MKTQIIQIGNSQGIRIPKILLEEAKMSGEVDLEICEDGILVRNIQKPRGDWDAIFTSLADNDDDETLDAASPPTAFEKKEWQW